MSKSDMINILILLSQMEGYLLGKMGAPIPQPMSEDLADICEMLSAYIRETE